MRATTTICHALSAGATAVVPCLEIDEARAKAGRVSGLVALGGERQGLRIEGFDLGNSPSEYTPETVGGRTVVFTTTNGTRAMHRAAQAAEILIGAFVNRRALVRELRNRKRVDLLCAGTHGAITAEDCLLAGAVVEGLADGPVELNDQARLARDAWRTVREGGPLAAALRECQGGRNLIAEGFDADIDTAAVADRFELVPRLDASTGRITLRLTIRGATGRLVRSVDRRPRQDGILEESERPHSFETPNLDP